jgi:hypothetical protein
VKKAQLLNIQVAKRWYLKGQLCSQAGSMAKIATYDEQSCD